MGLKKSFFVSDSPEENSHLVGNHESTKFFFYYPLFDFILFNSLTFYKRENPASNC